MSEQEPMELSFDALRKSGKFNDFVKELIQGNRGRAVEALVGAVVALATGTPALALAAMEGTRLLREKAEAATDRMLQEYERVQKADAAKSDQAAVQAAFAERLEVELTPWFSSTLRVLADIRAVAQRTEAKMDAQGEVLKSQTASLQRIEAMLAASQMLGVHQTEAFFREFFGQRLESEWAGAISALQSDRYEEALKSAQTALDALAKIPSPTSEDAARRASWRLLKAATLLNLQDLDASLAEVAQVEAWHLTPIDRLQLAELNAELGRLEDAKRLLADVRAEAAASDERVQVATEEVETLLRLCAGELPDDLERFPWLRLKAAQVAVGRGALQLAAQLAREGLPSAGSGAHGATKSDTRPALLYSIAGLILLRVVADAVFACPGANGLPPAELEAVIDEIERRLPEWEAALQTLPPRYNEQFDQAQYAYFEAMFDLDGRESMEREQRVPANDPRVEEARGLARSGELSAAIDRLPWRSCVAAWAHQLDVARLALESGDRQGYRDRLAAITREHPEAGPVQLALALAYHREGNTARAIEHAQQALSAVPAASYRAVLAACLADGGRSTEAWQLLSRDLDSRRPRIIVQLAELTEKQAPQQAPELWRRYAKLTGRHEARLREVRALAAAGREDEAARRAWELFEQHAAELDPEGLFSCTWLQRALASSFERDERLRRAARMLNERFPNDPRAQQLRLRIHVELGDAAEARFDKFELLESARLVLRFNADEMIHELVEMKQASTGRESMLWDFYTAGGISLRGLAKSLRAPLVRLVEAIADGRRPVCAPMSFESAMSPELSGCELLLDEPACLLLGSLDLLPVLARVAAASGLLVVLPSNARDAVLEAVLDSGSASGREARTLRAVRDFLVEGLEKEWLRCLDWPELLEGLAEPIPEVPPVRDAQLEQIVREPLNGALQLAGAVLARPCRWRASLDHFGHWGVHHRDALQSMVWRDPQEPMRLSLFLRRAASKMLSVPQLVRLLWQHSATSDYCRLPVLQRLAAAGFPDGMTGAELARASSLTSTDDLGSTLNGLEQSCRPSAPLGGFLGRHSVCETYSHALVAGFLGVQARGATVDDVGETVADASWFGAGAGMGPSPREGARCLAELLLGRVERLSAGTGTMLERLLSQVAALVLRSRRASFVPGPVADEYEISATSAAGGLWQHLGEWAGGDGSRRNALNHALRDAWCVLDALSDAEGPTLAAQAPLVLAQRVTRGLASQGRSRPSNAVPQLDDAEVPAILSWSWKAKPLEHDGLWFSLDDGEKQMPWETILAQAHQDLAGLPSGASLPFDERYFRRDLQLGTAGDGRSRLATVLAPVEAVLLRLDGDDLRRMAPYVRYLQGRHDGHAYELLMELGAQPADEAQRRRYARYSATALWRAVRDDPAYLLRWPERVPVFDDELRPSLEGLCRILHEPLRAVGEHAYSQWLEIWGQHLTESIGKADAAARWVARDLLLFAGETPGVSYGPEALLLLTERDVGFAQDALKRIREPESHPAAVLARDVLVLRWLSVRQPVLALDGGTTDLREVLPELLEQLLRSVRPDATVQAASAAGPPGVPLDVTSVTFASREHDLLRACGGVVWKLLGGKVDRRQSDFCGSPIVSMPGWGASLPRLRRSSVPTASSVWRAPRRLPGR